MATYYKPAKREQAMIKYKGRTQTIKEWAEETGMSPQCLLSRLRVGWSVRDALTKPVRKKSK